MILIISRVSLESLIVSKCETFLETFIPEIGSNVNQPRYPMCPLCSSRATRTSVLKDFLGFPRQKSSFNDDEARRDESTRFVSAET